MKIFNTLTRKVEVIFPINKDQLTIYTCGPTVYDHAHIGHWFNYIRMDLLVRALKAENINTKWVINITDVGHLTSDADEGEDKLEKGARREGKTAWEVASFYTEEFLSDMKNLNILTPDIIVKATDHINEQIDLIKTLEDKGYAYIIDDGVYYDTSKFEGYESFAKLDLDEQQAGARVSFNKQKRNISDFALWKFSPKDSKRDMEWDSPWGKGFPGWHIECSAMSMKYLGSTLDIHTGGIDHVPVHHTNEIAQSEAATGKRFANYWMHSNHITINGEKVSKSLGNGISLSELIEKGYSAQTLRLNVLESHYQSQSKFSWDGLNAAETRLNELKAVSALRYQAIDSDINTVDYTKAEEEIKNLLTDNLNTPQVVAYISTISAKILDEGISLNKLEEFNNMLNKIDQMLGLELMGVNDIPSEAKEIISQREKARQTKDWFQSDKLRDKLIEMNIQILDRPNRSQWQWID